MEALQALAAQRGGEQAQLARMRTEDIEMAAPAACEMVKEDRMRTDRTRVVNAELFFRSDYRRPVREPNERFWWHSMPLPNGDQIAGAHEDRNIQVQMWKALSIEPPNDLAGKTVLDVGANDGYFTIAALLCGRQK